MDLSLGLQGSQGTHRAYGALEYLHRISAGTSAFARGELGYGSAYGLDYAVLGGLRMRW